MAFWKSFASIVLLCLICANPKGGFVCSNENFELVQDIETENFLKSIIRKIYSAGNINKPIKVFIVNADVVNAFATYGGNIYVFTGLLKQLDSAAEVFAVLAHEIGHVICKHIELLEDYQKKQSKLALLSIPTLILCPLALTLLAEEGFKYSRSKENEADNFAIGIFQKCNYSLEPMKKLMLFFRNEKKLNVSNDLTKNILNKLTHPADDERLANIKNHLLRERKGETIPFDKDLEKKFQFIKYKLISYTSGADNFISNYPENITDEIKYGKAIAFGKIYNLKKSVELFDILLRRYFKNNEMYSYILDSKAQTLFENGELKDSLKCYEILLKRISDPDDIINTKICIARIKMSYDDWDPDEILKSLNSSLNKDSNIIEKFNFNPEILKILTACFGKLDDKLMKKICVLKREFIIAIEQEKCDLSFLENIKSELKSCLKKLDLKSTKNYENKKLMIEDFLNNVENMITKIS